MGEIVLRCGIKREAGYLYYLDKNGNLCKAKMSRKGRRKGTTNR